MIEIENKLFIKFYHDFYNLFENLHSIIYKYFYQLKTLIKFLASVAFIFQPIGSILSGIVLEPLGRKRSMILVNAPHIVGWLMLYYAKSLEAMYGAAILLGLGVGLMEAPIGN